MGAHTQGSGLARNPGLGNRNSYRVAAAYVCFVMEGIMFVCMDVGVAGGAHSSISTVMRRMTTASPTVQKAACGRKKSLAHAGKKNSCLWWVQPQPGLGLFRALGWAERCALYIK